MPSPPVVIGAALIAAALLLAARAGFQLAVRRRPNQPVDWVSQVSHELRTPLTSVSGILDLLGEESLLLDPDEAGEMVGLARQEAAQLRRLVDNLLTLSRLEQGTVRPRVRPLAMAEVVEQALDSHPSVAARTVLGRADGVAALADPELTAQIVGNLFQNVARYAPEGLVEVTAQRVGDRVELAVSDDGPGIPDSQREAVFEGVGRRESSRGLGIGLGLSRRLARLAGGDLAVGESRRSGATLLLTLPASEERAVALPRPPATSGVIPPRARLLLEVSEALSAGSLEMVAASLSRLYRRLLGATGGVLLIPEGDRLSSVGGGPALPAGHPVLAAVLTTGRAEALGDLTLLPGAADLVGGGAALVLPATDRDAVVGVLVIGWPGAADLPSGRAREVAEAMASLSAVAIERASLAESVLMEQRLRAGVIDALPIAVSVFAGDPPRLVASNPAERALLGLEAEPQRPVALDASQRAFDVRFADGTPLTIDNAPVTQTIRRGVSTGPFLLRVRRRDGSELVTRTYCVPYFGPDGRPAGAVVTSERLSDEELRLVGVDPDPAQPAA
jgi:K+-sensing histidine kinase KdpD